MSITAEFSDWVQEVVEWLPDDRRLPGGLDSINVTLNRRRLAEFLETFSTDSDVLDFLLLDVLAVQIEAEISSTGVIEQMPDLSLRPFRLWEYIWLYKALELSGRGKFVLDLGGPASHLVISAALAGNRICSVDLNPRIVQAGRQCARVFQLEDYRAEAGDMCDLSAIASGTVDRIVCCSVLEHLTAADQKRALSEMARVLAPGGVIGLTFDYGRAAPEGNPYLPPPHEPPETANEVRDRYVQGDLQILGDYSLENPIPGSLFRSREVSYTIGALFLGKPPLHLPTAPVPVHRQHSIDPYPHIPGVIARLQKQALISASRAESASALRQVADERLTALVETHKELDRLYLELNVRGQKLLELHEKLQSWPALEADLRRVAEDRQKMLEEAHSEVLKLSAELDDGKRQMQNLQSQVQERDTRLDQLQGEVLDVRKELLALRSQNLLGFLRNRSRRYLPRKKS